jgi:hypothetical protein
VLWSSLIKETIKRKRPSFNETFYGYKSFGRLLEDAARRGLVDLTRDGQNRSYVVTRFGAEMARPGTATASVVDQAEPREQGTVRPPRPPSSRRRPRSS